MCQSEKGVPENAGLFNELRGGKEIHLAQNASPRIIKHLMDRQ